jgi:predicted kinase
MESLKTQVSHSSPLLPPRHASRLYALTGLPGAGLGTVARLICTEFGAKALSMADYPRLRLQAEGSARGAVEEALPDYRLQRERTDRLTWIRPFHRRLLRMLRHSPPPGVVITNVLTQAELAYCKALGAHLVYLTAPIEVRRQRIGARYPSRPVAAHHLLERLVQTQPQLWDLIIDTNEPYPEFVRGIRSRISGFRE